jgi:hypothetical protein
MTSKMKELKALLKEKAAEIRNKKRETKEYQRKHCGRCGGRQWTLFAMKEDYRVHHVAYSLMRGKTIEQIEPNASTDPNWYKVERIKEEYCHEDVCACAS